MSLRHRLPEGVNGGGYCNNVAIEHKLDSLCYNNTMLVASVVILVSALCQGLVGFSLLLLARKWYVRESDTIREEILQTVRGFIEAPNGETPSALAVIADQFATLFAARLLQQAKSMLGGVASKVQQSEQLALIEEAAEANPLVSMLANMLPKRIRNNLLKNPQLVGALAKFGGGNNHSVAGGGGDDVSDRIGRKR